MSGRFGGNKPVYRDLEISSEEAQLSQRVRDLVNQTSKVLDEMKIHAHERDVLTDLYRGYATNIRPGSQKYNLECLALAIQEIIQDPEGFVKKMPLSPDYEEKRLIINSFT